MFEIRQPESLSIGKFLIITGSGNDIKKETEILSSNPSCKDLLCFIGGAMPARSPTSDSWVPPFSQNVWD